MSLLQTFLRQTSNYFRILKGNVFLGICICCGSLDCRSVAVKKRDSFENILGEFLKFRNILLFLSTSRIYLQRSPVAVDYIRGTLLKGKSTRHFDHLTNVRSREKFQNVYLQFQKTSATKLGRVVISGRRFRMQIFKLSTTFCFDQPIFKKLYYFSSYSNMIFPYYLGTAYSRAGTYSTLNTQRCVFYLRPDTSQRECRIPQVY